MKTSRHYKSGRVVVEVVAAVVVKTQYDHLKNAVKMRLQGTLVVAVVAFQTSQRKIKI
jgi:hypothetical protein